MTTYYLKATVDSEDINVVLDATTDIRETFVADLPSFRLEDGTEGADHHTLKAPVIAFKGILTDVKSLSSGFLETGPNQDVDTESTERVRTEDGARRWKSVKDNKDVLRQIWKDHLPVTIFTDRTVYEDCYITGLGFTQNSKFGTINNKSASEVSLTFKQPVRGARAVVVAERDLDAARAYQTKARENGAKQELTEEQRHLNYLNELANRDRSQTTSRRLRNNFSVDFSDTSGDFISP